MLKQQSKFFTAIANRVRWGGLKHLITDVTSREKLCWGYNGRPRKAKQWSRAAGGGGARKKSDSVKSGGREGPARPIHAQVKNAPRILGGFCSQPSPSLLILPLYRNAVPSPAQGELNLSSANQFRTILYIERKSSKDQMCIIFKRTRELNFT
jgi:hypothetical protein